MEEDFPKVLEIAGNDKAQPIKTQSKYYLCHISFYHHLEINNAVIPAKWE